MNRDKMIEWIATHHVGTSSRTMWTGLMGVNAQPTQPFLYFDIPYDSDDFSRCYDLVKFCEVEPTEDFPKILQRFPWYAPIVRCWNRLTELYEAGNHRGVFNLLSELVEESRTLRRMCEL